MKPRHTKIEEAIETPRGLLVREAYYGHPRGVSNIYLLDEQKKIKWEAELPMERDVYANRIFLEGDSFRCASWEGFTCTISLESGKITHELFTK